jgi:hypothetical protein
LKELLRLRTCNNITDFAVPRGQKVATTRKKMGREDCSFYHPLTLQIECGYTHGYGLQEETALTLLHLSEVNNGFTWNSEGWVVPAIGKAH